VDRTPLLVYTIDRDCSAALMFSMIPMMPASVAIFESTGTPQCTERDIEKNTMWITYEGCKSCSSYQKIARPYGVSVASLPPVKLTIQHVFTMIFSFVLNPCSHLRKRNICKPREDQLDLTTMRNARLFLKVTNPPSTKSKFPSHRQFATNSAQWHWSAYTPSGHLPPNAAWGHVT